MLARASVLSNACWLITLLDLAVELHGLAPLTSNGDNRRCPGATAHSLTRCKSLKRLRSMAANTSSEQNHLFFDPALVRVRNRKMLR